MPIRELRPDEELDAPKVRELRPDEELDQPGMSFGEKIYKGVVAPTVEMGGLILGGTAGAAAGGPFTSLAGAGLGYAGARRLTKAGSVALGYEQPEKPIEAFTQAGKDVVSGVTAEMGGQVIGRGAGKIIEKGGKIKESIARKFYESAIKPVPSLKTSIREQAITTGLENAVSGKGYRPTEKHLYKVSKDISNLVNQADDIVKSASKTGDTVSVDKIASSIDDLAKEYAKGPFPVDDIVKLQQLKREFIETHGNKIPVAKALEMKKYIYEVAKKHYEAAKRIGPVAVDPIKIDTEKSIARAIRTELEELYPVTGPINRQVSKQIEFGKVLERAANRVGNRELFSFFDFMGGTIGGVVGGGHGAAAGALLTKVGTGAQAKSVIAKELMKSRIPIALKMSILEQATKYGIIWRQDQKEQEE